MSLPRIEERLVLVRDRRRSCAQWPVIRFGDSLPITWPGYETQNHRGFRMTVEFVVW
jgi:hypothetical protein